MNEQQWNEGLNNIDPEIVEEHIRQQALYEKKRRQRKRFAQLGAMAACLCLIIAAAFALPVSAPMPPATEPSSSLDGSIAGTSAGQESPLPQWDGAQCSASELAELFGVSDNTNAYQQVWVPSGEQLYYVEMPQEEELIVYQKNILSADLDAEEFKDFFVPILSRFAQAMGAEMPEYTINQNALSSDGYMYVHIFDVVGETALYAYQYFGYESAGVSNYEDGICLDGIALQIDQWLDDEQIIESLAEVKEKLFELIGVSFTDVKVIRNYWAWQESVAYMEIYFYNGEDGIYSAATTERLPSDYVCLTFSYPENATDEVDDSILSGCEIEYCHYRQTEQTVTPLATARRISLEEAEELLYSDCVFGGHICDLCMAAQDKISFEGYDYVGLEYVFGREDDSLGIPFYVFYKQIEEASNGMICYAKTYVAAIEVSGYEEYLQSQTQYHSTNTLG